MIQLEAITKNYMANNVCTHALRGIDLTIEDGAYLAIVGTSGSGKSTLLHILGGMDTATTGNYWLDGEKVSAYSARQLQQVRKRAFSFVFQHFALMQCYSVYENVEMPLLARNETNRKQKVLKQLEQLGIATLKDKYPNQLSGGQQQRVALARALVADTPYFLADEPTGSLDQATSQDTMRCIQAIHDTGKTVILVTHDLYIAEQCDHIVQIEDGIISSP